MTKFILVNTLSQGINKVPGTLGSHRIERRDNKVRGVRLGKDVFIPYHFNGVVGIDDLVKLDQHNGQLGSWESVIDPITDWIPVTDNTVISYSCGFIKVLRGRYAKLQKDIINGVAGAWKALVQYITDRRAMRFGDKALYDALIARTTNVDPLKINIKWVDSLPDGYDHTLEYGNSQYRCMNIGTVANAIDIKGYKVLEVAELGFGRDRAAGTSAQAVTYLVCRR